MGFTTLPTSGAEMKASTLAALINEVRPVSAIKTADESVTSSAVLQDDDELFISVAASTNYDVLVHVIYDATTASDIKFAFTFPSGATFPWGQMALDPAAGSTVGNVSPTAFASPTSGSSFFSVGGGGAGNQMLVILSGTLSVSTTAGTLRLQWAQSSSGGTASIVKAGSRMVARMLG